MYNIKKVGRKVFDELQLGTGVMNRKFTYLAGEITQAHTDANKRKSDAETTLVKEIVFANGRTIQYDYDNEERITKVIDSVVGTTEYTYDALGQLLTEKVNGNAVNTMTYDTYGNIKTKNGTTYTYDSVWKDKLVKVGSKTINYDASGNPTSYLGKALEWEKGRQLKKFGSTTFGYNKDGIRIEKVANGTTHKYVLGGSNIIKEIVSRPSQGYVNEYFYDLDGSVCGIKHCDDVYYFYKNLQGDIIGITDNNGMVVATYSYDAWGKWTITSDFSGCDIATVNPFRYRGYYYDTDVDLYYLQSRYYDPVVGRFINADKVDMFAEDKTFNYNRYCYCQNNPLNNCDDNGEAIIGIIKKVIDVIMAIVGGLVGMYLADVLTNIIQNKKDYKRPVQSVGAYLAEAVRSAGIALFGNALVKRLWLALGVSLVKFFTDFIFGNQATIWTFVSDLILNIVLTVIACNSDKIFAQLKKLKNKHVIKNKFLKYIKNIVDHLIEFFKIVWKGLRECMQLFYKRFSIKLLSSFVMNFVHLIMG